MIIPIFVSRFSIHGTDDGQWLVWDSMDEFDDLVFESMDDVTYHLSQMRKILGDDYYAPLNTSTYDYTSATYPPRYF